MNRGLRIFVTAYYGERYGYEPSPQHGCWVVYQNRLTPVGYEYRRPLTYCPTQDQCREWIARHEHRDSK